LKGERFNVFSILKMERSENSTHSKFLGELLNPWGSHLKKTTFLNLFLETIKLDNHLSIETSVVTLEFHIGQKNDFEKTGGRIDIFIKDGNGKSVSIENKIYAGDQDTQIERYCNYNKKNNKVIYLTLDGREPTDESKGELLSGRDYQILSYQDDISNWLQLCLKEAADTPILRESIKQYILLINNMTSTPDKQHENELIELVMDNYEAATFVSNMLKEAKRRIADSVRHEVREKLLAALPNSLTVSIGNPIDKTYAQLWVGYREIPNAILHFGIESFNGTGNYRGDLFIGVFNSSGTANSYTNEFAAIAPKPRLWYEIEFLEFEGARINFGNDNLILNIKRAPKYRERLIEEITIQIVNYITPREKKLVLHLNETDKKDL